MKKQIPKNITTTQNNIITPTFLVKKGYLFKKKSGYTSNVIVPVGSKEIWEGELSTASFMRDLGSDVVEEDHSIIGKSFNQFFMFINALKLETSINPLLCLSIHLVMMYQTLSLSYFRDNNWGVYGTYIVDAIIVPRTFGFQFLPYDGFIGLLAFINCKENNGNLNTPLQ